MENNNGALSFDVLVRDSNIQQMLAKDEQRIREFTENVESNSESIVTSFGNIGSAVAGMAITATLQSWVRDIINVRGEFQQLEIAFTTMLGSGAAAKAMMAQITNTAATTPYDLAGVANGAKQLLAYGESAESVNDTLVRLGNIASGLSIPLNDIVQLYGTSMVQGRLFTQDVRQFMGRGIPLVQELSKALGKTEEEINSMVTAGKIGFNELRTVIENLTNNGGMFYNLMEEQSKSLTGQISNLGDAWDSMLNKIGEHTEGILSAGISTVTELVEHYDTCIAVLGRLVAVYGTYKVATAAVAIAQGKSTGMAALDNIVIKARLGLFTSVSAQMREHIRNNQLMTASQQAYTAELQKLLTVEQQEQILRTMRINAIMQLLTAEQQQYVSRIKETEGTAAYLQQLEALLTVEQQVALSKKNLTAQSMAYSVAVEQSVRSTQGQIAAELTELKTSAAQLKQKQAALVEEYRLSLNKIEATRVQIALAQQEGNTTAVAALKQQQYNQLKQHAVIVANMKSTATAKEAATERIATLAKQQGAIASKTAAASNAMQAASTNLLTTATSGLVKGLRMLWATMIANPITAIATAVTTVISLITLFGDKTEEDIDIQGEFQDSVTDTYTRLNTLFAVLKNGEKGTKTYKDALEQVNHMCKEHSIEVLKETDSLNMQVKAHDALIESIERETATRLKAKYIEQAMVKVNDENAESLKRLAEAAQNATHVESAGYVTTYSARGGGVGQTEQFVETESKSIQEANAALWEAVIAMANESAQKLEGLTGDAYKKEHDRIMKAIVQSVQDATGASEREMDAFKPALEQTVDEVITTTGKADKQVKQIESSINSMFASFGSTFQAEQVTKEIDLLSLSFSELETMAAQAEQAIESAGNKELNVKIGEQTFTDLQSLQQYLDRINQALGTKTTNLNTENGISARIKELKEQRAEAEINSKEWKKLDAQIKALENRLPDAAGKIATKAEQAAEAVKKAGEKAVEVQLEVEQKRIEAITDAYEKRKAELDLQHKQELARIDKEQRQLTEAYKKGGKAMPVKVTVNFDNLRDMENSEYERKQTSLMSEEVEYKRKQYEVYYKWVTAYGREVANTQFAQLIAAGETYEQWLEAKIDSLSDKINSGTFTQDEGNRLISMQGQLDEIRGTASAMDDFNESLEEARDIAKTTTQYLTKLAEIRQKLTSGQTNLIGEDKAKAIHKIDEEIATSAADMQKQLLDKYKSNAELREEVERSYQEEITWLQQHGYSEQAELAKQARITAISELQAQQISTGSMWKHLFNTAQYLGGGAFDVIAEKLQKLIDEIEDDDIKRGLQNQLDGLRKETQGTKNPFKQLSTAIREYSNAGNDAVSQKQKLVEMFDAISKAAQTVKGSFDAIVGGLTKMGMAGDEETQRMLGNMSEMLGGIEQLSEGMSTGNPVAMISGSVSIITSAIDLFDSTSRRIRREMKQHEVQLKSLQRMYSQVSWEVENAIGEDYYKKQNEAIANLMQQQAEYEELARLERSKKAKDRDDEKVQEYLEAAEDIKRQIADIEKEVRETLVQTSFKNLANELADTWSDSFSKMESASKDFDKVFAQTITNAVKNALKLKIIEPVVDDFTKELADYMGIHDNSVVGFDFSKWKQILSETGETFVEGLNEFKDFFALLGDETSETLEGQVKAVTEETAGKLAGEITTMRIRQYEMLQNAKNTLGYLNSTQATLRTCLSNLQTIAQNTSYNRHLLDISEQLRQLNGKIEATSDPLRAKGIQY